jgi:hypothetical protein
MIEEAVQKLDQFNVLNQDGVKDYVGLSPFMYKFGNEQLTHEEKM